MNVEPRRAFRAARRHQTGVATLVVTLVILAILTIIVLSATHVALFEQKTTTNEYRQRLADQAAEYALNLGSEYFKANVVNIASKQTDGWLPGAGATAHWATCASVSGMSATHPCMSEPNPTRRAKLYYYTYGGSTSVPYNSLVASTGQLADVGGVFDASGTTVTALLCRLDTTVVVSGVTTPECVLGPEDGGTLSPASANRIAITVATHSTLAGESSASEMKATYGNFDTFSVGASVPLVASGSVNAVGNAEIVTAANGGGTGIPVSIWSAEDADVDCWAGGSCASVNTCQIGEFLKSTPESQLLTTCATVNNACGCPAMSNGSTQEEILAKNPNMLSGHVAGPAHCCENIDILDRDAGRGISPDIVFYPGKGMDDYAVGDDDSLFEWVFNVSTESNTTKTSATDTTHVGQQGATLTNCAPIANCAVNALSQPDQLNAQLVTCAQLGALGASATGLYYVTDSSASNECDLPAQIGSPGAPALVVINDRAQMNSTLFYGLLFIRSDTKTAQIRGTGHAQVFGSVVVEGDVRTMAGGFTIVYANVNVSKPGDRLPETTRFGMLPGSWLDGSRAGF
jgi:Tfp pilus assembly protein PilX